MKKCLILGVFILSSVGLLVSCSHEEEYTGSIAESKVQAFEELFASEFGTIDPNQDWGFSSATTFIPRTRGNSSVNANQWADNGYSVPQELTQGQIDRVVAYFQSNQLSDGGSKDWTDFFIQQVYKGKTSPKGDKNNPNGYSPEEYKAANNSWYSSGDQMNYLTVNGSTDHVSNFNNGDCGSNSSVQNSPGVKYYTDNGNGYHTDKIQLIVDSKATNFGYQNSQASYTYWNHYALVDGSVIDEWADSQNPVIGAPVSGRAFVGLDFDMLPMEECIDNYSGFRASDFVSEIRYVISEDGRNYIRWYDANSWYVYNYQYVRRLDSRTNLYYAEEKINLQDNQIYEDVYSYSRQYLGKAFNKPYIDSLISQDYRPTSSNLKEWIKIGSCRDYYYSDWIVCIAPAIVEKDTPSLPVDNSVTTTTYSNTTTTTEYYQNVELVEEGRVFCEDLGKVDNNDLDFNDVVFDAYVYKTTYSTRTIVETDDVKISDNEETTGTEYNTYIYLLAAGGTMPLEVAGFEVHNAFGGAGTTTIINTITNSEESYGNAYISCNPVKLEGNFDYQHIKDIPIYVWFKSNNEVFQLQSNLGEAPHKICVPIGTPWCLERKQLKETYKNFGSYVSNSSFDCWSTENNKDYIVTANLFGNLTYDAPGVTTGKTRIGEPEVTTSTSGSSTTTGGYGGGTVLSRER